MNIETQLVNIAQQIADALNDEKNADLHANPTVRVMNDAELHETASIEMPFISTTTDLGEPNARLYISWNPSKAMDEDADDVDCQTLILIRRDAATDLFYATYKSTTSNTPVSATET